MSAQTCGHPITEQKARIMLTICHAYDHLRPRMVGDTRRGIPQNGESLAGTILARAINDVMMDARND